MVEHLILPAEVTQLEDALEGHDAASIAVPGYVITVRYEHGMMTIPQRYRRFNVYVLKNIFDKPVHERACTGANLRSTLLDVLNACRLGVF